MIVLNGFDFELSTIKKEPTFGYQFDYFEKTMMSGKIRRIVKGRRFVGNITYAYLTDTQRDNLFSCLEEQKRNGYIEAQISTPQGSTFTGQVILDINEDMVRFKYDNQQARFVWLNYTITIKGVNYD